MSKRYELDERVFTTNGKCILSDEAVDLLAALLLSIPDDESTGAQPDAVFVLSADGAPRAACEGDR